MDEGVRTRINEIRNMATDDIHKVFISPKQRIMMLLDYLENGGDLKEMGAAVARGKGVKRAPKVSKVKAENPEGDKDTHLPVVPDSVPESIGQRPGGQDNPPVDMTVANDKSKVPAEDDRTKNEGVSTRKPSRKKWF